jgi:hypothetical protein
VNSNIAYISANIDIPNGCPMECRINMKGEIEFSIGTWQGGVEILFDRYALERFSELATTALAEPVPANPEAARPILRSPGT